MPVVKTELLNGNEVLLVDANFELDGAVSAGGETHLDLPLGAESSAESLGRLNALLAILGKKPAKIIQEQG